MGASSLAVVMRYLICDDPFGVPPSSDFAALCCLLAVGTAAESFGLVLWMKGEESSRVSCFEDAGGVVGGVGFQVVFAIVFRSERTKYVEGSFALPAFSQLVVHPTNSEGRCRSPF